MLLTISPPVNLAPWTSTVATSKPGATITPNVAAAKAIVASSPKIWMKASFGVGRRPGLCWTWAA